jgi:hypothetical protein
LPRDSEREIRDIYLSRDSQTNNGCGCIRKL